MYSKIWNVGLDIQSNCLRALAVVRRRCGWQLRRWWQQPLPAGILCNGNLQYPETLSEILRQWRVQLPQNVSLRIALPPQLVLQQTIPVPDKRLKEPERSWFIYANAAKKFPLNSQVLALDYRFDPTNNTELRVTAARQDELQRWQHCLQLANLMPQVIDITPCVLQSMAFAAGLLPQYLLLHHLANEWLWVSPLNAPFQYGLIPSGNGDSVQDVVKKLYQLYFPGFDDLLGVYYSSVIDEPIPDNVLTWSPFSVFKQMHPPFPTLPMAFILAGGLALRSADNLCLTDDE